LVGARDQTSCFVYAMQSTVTGLSATVQEIGFGLHSELVFQVQALNVS